MKKNIFLVGALALLLLSVGCSAERQNQIGDAPSRAKSRAMQVEAQLLLKQIYTMQRAYYNMHKSYTDNLNKMGMTLPGNTSYSYSLRVNGDTWTCAATANLDNDATIDRWVIDQNGGVRCITNDATS